MRFTYAEAWLGLLPAVLFSTLLFGPVAAGPLAVATTLRPPRNPRLPGRIR